MSAGHAPDPGGAARRLRVFLGAFGQPGHAFPMLALGRELVRRGHQVTYETWSRWREPAQDAGMTFLAAPEYPVFPPQAEPLGPYEAIVRAAAHTRPALARADPDVVVHDILTLAPALAGELEQRPVATLIPHVYPVGEPGFAPYAFGARMPRTAFGRRAWRVFDGPVARGLARGRAELNATRTQLGLAPVERFHGGLSPELVIVGTYPELEYPRAWPGHVHVVGPLIWEPPAAAVAPPPGDAPLVVVAPSTAQDPDHRLLRAALAGLGGERIRVLATWNRRPLPGPAAVSAHTRLVEWISYAQTMREAALVVCHAGHGTLVRAIASGASVLAVPHAGDMAENAARADWAGVGVRLPWALLSPQTLRLAVRRALERPELAANVARIAAATPLDAGPARAADLIEGLARGQSRAAGCSRT